MKSKYNLSLIVAIILLSINAVYPLNLKKEKKELPTEKENSFWKNHQENWVNIKHFNTNSYWNQNTTTAFTNDRTITISNKKIATSTDDSYEDNKGNNEPRDLESGNIRFKGFRFTNLNIPSNATINNVTFTFYGYKHGNTTVSVKAENLKSPTTFSDNDDYLSSRSTTSKSTNWYIPKLSNGLEVTSPNLKDVVQEVVNNNGGIEHLSLIIASSKKWEAWNFDDRSSSLYPKINISYSIKTPEVKDDIISMDENTVASISIFSNDSNIPTNGSLKISTSPRNGSVTISDSNNTSSNPSDDVVTYTPKENFDGTDTFKYTICDNDNNCDAATVTITVNSVIDPCDAALSGNLDTDKDGIADVCDLDDDNDGILDTDECPEVNPFKIKLNEFNKSFSKSGKTGNIGDVMLYRNVGRDSNNNIDLKITVIANSDAENMSIDISGLKFGNDYYPIILDGENKAAIPFASLKFEFLKSGTNNLINVAPSFMFKDIDFLSDGSSESVEIDKSLVSSYSLSKNPSTDLYIADNITKNYLGNNGSFLRINSKKEGANLSDENLWIALQLLQLNSFTINFLKRTGNTGYIFESDDFSKTANTVQLDANCALDTDNDGIPNYLDTDSDNDGCPDATEADKNVTTTAILQGGSNGGSAANLGTVVNKNGIPVPFGKENGTGTNGQKNTDATKTAEKIDITTKDFTISSKKHVNLALTINATATKTNTFVNGEPNYNSPNGTNTTNSLTYYWYKKDNPNKRLSSTKTLNFYYLRTTEAGEYVVRITSANSNCAEESTFTLQINDTPEAKDDWFNAKEDEANTSLNILKNDDLGDDDAKSGQITLVSEKSEKNGTLAINDNNTPENPKDDTIFYTSAQDYFGSDSFQYTITDASGDTSTATANLYVNATNDLPLAVNDLLTIDENSEKLSINVTENDDFGGDGPNSGQIFITDSRSDKKGSISVDNNNTNISSDDKITYTPPTNFSGTDSFTYNIQDANGDGSKATVTITINSVNSLPIATSDAITVNEDSSENAINVLENDDFGKDGANTGTITLTNTTSNKGGLLIVNNNNTPNNPSDDVIIYSPLADFNGQDSFEYSITDANNDTAKATVTITVTSVNDTPTAKADNVTFNEDSTNNVIDVLNNDSFGGDDSNNKSITIASANSDKGGAISVDDNGTATNPKDDKIIYTPLANFNGKDTFKYTITDKNGDTSSTEVTIIVNAVNDFPNAIADAITVDEDSSNTTINVLANDDFGGDGPNEGTIILVSETSTQGAVISVNNNNTASNPKDDTILYSPLANFNGTDTFSYKIIDKNGDASSAEITVTVNSINDEPTAFSDAVTVDEDSSNNIFNVTENDDFGGDGSNVGKISITATTTLENGTIYIDDNATPTNPKDDKITYTPLANFQGMDSFTYTITDSDGDFSTATVSINVNSVNDVPSANSDSISVDEDSANNSINVLVNDNFGGDGSNSGTITLVKTASNQGGILTVNNNSTPNNPLDDAVFYTPFTDFNGTDSFEYSITDANGDISTATVTITVNAVNDLPTATADTATVDEDSSLNYLNVLENDNFGGDGKNIGTISLIATTSNQGGALTVNNNSTPNNPSDDAVLYSPVENFNGTDSFKYSITDANGDISTATVTVTVNSVNDFPLSTEDTATVDEDVANNLIDVLANDSFGGDGSNSGTISIPSTETTKKGTISVNNNATPTNPIDDKISYTPFANFNGTDTFEYSITDANGDISTSKVTITVNSTNDVPTAVNDTFTVEEDSEQNNITIFNNDDFGGDGKPLRGGVTVESPTNGGKLLVRASRGNQVGGSNFDIVYYTPAKDFNGTESFNYTITDLDGDTSTATVTITVNNVNDLPIATADKITVEEDSNSNSIPVASNDDFGGDGSNIGTISIPVATSTQNGTLSIDDNGTANNPTDDKINYTPFANFNGTDSFEYTITDSNGDTSNATVTMTVSPVNDVPIALADVIIIDEDAENTLINVLANDSFGGDGFNSGAISIVATTSEKGGTIAIDNNATETDPTDDKIIYNPAANYNGSDVFEYSITDANGDISTATVTVTINAVNDVPTAINDAFTVDEDSSSNQIAIFNNDSFGGDGKPSRNSVTVETPSNGGKLLVRASRNNSVNGNNFDIIYYTPAENFNGIETFNYTIVDADGDKATATVTITVNNVNDTPVSINDNISVNENTTNTVINVLENDSFGGDDSNKNAILLTTETSLKGGLISVDDNATPQNPTDDKINYTPLANFTGLDSFQYTITDADLETATATVTINVTAVGTQYNPLSITECFNIFVKNKLTISKGNIDGSIATGGDLTFNDDVTIASQDCGCFAINDVNIGLLVGGKVNYPEKGVLNIKSEKQYAKIGEDNKATVWYLNPENNGAPIRVTPNENYNSASYVQLASNANSLDVSNSKNPLIENNLIDFESAFQQLQDVSLSLSTEISNAIVLNTDYKEISTTGLPSEIVINLESNVNYLNISSDDLKKVSAIEFFEKPSEKRILIINVDAKDTFEWNVWKQTNIDAENAAYIIYNFYNTKSLNISGENEIFGSVLAASANITKSQNKQAIAGQIIGQSLHIEDNTVKCTTFQSNIYSPEDAKVAPIANFTINNDNQCFVGNNFELDNLTNTNSNAQPTAPITYSWSFGDETSSILMNPIKTFITAGVYEITLTATNKYGATKVSKNVEVVAIINADVEESNNTKDEDAGTVTKEFTLNNDADFTNFSWSLEGFDTSSFDNQKTVSFTFTEEGEHVLSLKTFNNDCDNTLQIPITITSDEVSTGNDGGLESESLGDAISIRYFQRKRKDIPTIFKKTSANVYNKKKMVKSLARKSSDLTMLDMFPEKLVDGDVAHVTSPTDILDFTVADEVLSVDFSVDDKTIGVVLGVKTLDQIYNHTKATCDRLRGAEILNVRTVEIGGYNFLQQAIKQRNGLIEHAISFAISKNDAEDFYNIQTNWYVFDYAAANDVFNFQVWASDPVNTVKMVTDILANLNASKIVNQTEKQKIPRSFVTKVARVADKLNLNLKSFKETEDLEISIDEKLNETTTNLNARYTPLNNQQEQTLQLDINDGYEYDGDISFDGEVQDAFYHADGNWGLDYDRRFTTVNEYEVTNNFNREYKEDELPINRNVSIKAYSEFDYLSVYKSLLPGTIAADYSEYKYLSFTASGQGPTQLVLVKSGIENWSEQYRATVNLTDEEQTFFIPFESFTSTATTATILADDLTTISFTYTAVDAGTNNLDLKISDVKFTKKNSALNVDNFIAPKKNQFMVYPNPSKGNINCTIFSDVSTKANVTLFDITGKTVYKGFVDVTAGKNEINFNFKTKAGVLFLKINSSEINYGTTKIVFK